MFFIGRWCSRLIGPSYLETSTRPPAVPLVPLAMPNPETCLRCGESLWTQGGRLQVWPYCPVCSQVVVGVDIKESRIPGAGFGLFASRGFDPGQQIVRYSAKPRKAVLQVNYGTKQSYEEAVQDIQNQNPNGKYRLQLNATGGRYPGQDAVYLDSEDWDNFPGMVLFVPSYIFTSTC